MSTAIACRHSCALGALVIAACLDPLASDDPGFSPRIVDADAAIPSPGTALARSIDEEDGIDGNAVPRKQGFVGGKEIAYWELGPAPGVMRAAHQLYRCKEGVPTKRVDHPIVLSAIPGDSDYSPFLALQPVCVTSRYESQQIVSARALRDATTVGLTQEPSEPHEWLDAPVVAEGVSLQGAKQQSAPIYYEGLRLRSLRPTPPGPWSSRRVPAGHVFELQLPGGEGSEQVVFDDSDTPLWNVVHVDLQEGAELSSLTRAADLFEMDEDGGLTPASELIATFEETGERVHRVLIAGAEQ